MLGLFIPFAPARDNAQPHPGQKLLKLFHPTQQDLNYAVGYNTFLHHSSVQRFIDASNSERKAQLIILVHKPDIKYRFLYGCLYDVPQLYFLT